jgi:hypothetical protein
MTDHEMMIISALRYALSRRSYIMFCTEEYIVHMLKGKVSTNFIGVAIQDIEGHHDWNTRNKVDDRGQHNWKPLLEKLKSAKEGIK